jgi:hypothetical protein
MVPVLKQLSGNTILILRCASYGYVCDGTVNVGQIINEEHKPEEVFSVGFGSYKGRLLLDVRGRDVMQVMQVPEAVKHSWEYGAQTRG